MSGQKTSDHRSISREDRIVTLTEELDTRVFVQNSVRPMRVKIKSLNFEITPKGVGYNRSKPIEVVKTFVGQGYLVDGTVEIIGRSDTKSEQIPVRIDLYDPESMDITRQNLGLTNEQFGQPTVIVSYQEKVSDLWIKEEWWMSVKISKSLFSEIDNLISQGTFEDITFLITFDNIFTEGDGNPDEGLGIYTPTEFFLLKEKGFDWIFGDVKNVFLENKTLNHKKETNDENINCKDKIGIVSVKETNDIYSGKIVQKMNYIIISIVVLIFVNILF